MKLARPLFRVLALGLAIAPLNASAEAAPGSNVQAKVSFTTGDLFGSNATSRKCVKFAKAGVLDKVVCNCHTGTADLTVLDSDVSVFPTATATIQAVPLGIATGCTTSIIIDVGSSFISETPNFAELCIQATAIGGPAAVECKFRGSARKHGTP